MRVVPILAAAIAFGAAPAAHAQQAQPDPSESLKVARLVATPDKQNVQAGSSSTVKFTAYDAQGNVVNAPLRFATLGRNVQPTAVNCTPTDGCTLAFKATGEGVFQLTVTTVLPANATQAPSAITADISVSWPTVTRIEVSMPKSLKLYPGTTVKHNATAFHQNESKRPNPLFRWSSSSPEIASVDRFGNVTAQRAGVTIITAQMEGARGELRHTIPAFSATRLEITTPTDQLKTGDVVALGLKATGANGQQVSDMPVTWSYTFVPDDSIRAPGAAGEVSADGRFVAEVPGVYTVLAAAGPLQSRKSIDVRPREAVRQINLVGRGAIQHVHTADLWVFEGKDKRDYALVGTWGGDGWAYMFDVTNPASIVKTDSVKIDARTINDVTVSPDARWGVLSREGASNRRNGVVLLDLADPAHPKVTASFDEDLTGGVHNMFATNTHLFALSGGDKYIIIDVTDLAKPRKVGEYNHPDSRIHDVNVVDGVAYSSEWNTGVVMVDVGNGKWGGTLEKPVFINSYAYPVGATHEVFVHKQKDGRVYAFLGDEIMSRQGAAWAGTQYNLMAKGGVPQTTSGYVHIVDITDPMNPKDVARYEQREFGSHDVWVDGDILYQAYYDGGLRVIDVGGELMGDLANQGREIAIFKTYDPDGYVSNAPMVMNAQPYKGHIFLTDFNSGLWSVKLMPKPPKPAT
ncbi:MAG: Ig-like domain-containing protein [Longimicrobiales bacterium]